MTSCCGSGNPALPSTPLCIYRLVFKTKAITSFSQYLRFRPRVFPPYVVLVVFQASLADNPRATLMVRNRVQEALRVSTLPKRSGTAPVFVYMRPVFVDQNRRFLSQVNKSQFTCRFFQYRSHSCVILIQIT